MYVKNFKIRFFVVKYCARFFLWLSLSVWKLASYRFYCFYLYECACLNYLSINVFKTISGKKLKCPFCERLYGYETNLRAHIRQRHQGIRVPCPFCSRTFTRNNTVRRHIAREHKNELNLKAFQNQQQNLQQVHNHNP